MASDPNNELSVASLLTVDCVGSPRNGGTTLSPGECARFTANWTPTAPHAAAGAIEVDSSDMQSPVVTLPVSGTAVVSGCYPSCTSSQACCGDVCVDTQYAHCLRDVEPVLALRHVSLDRRLQSPLRPPANPGHLVPTKPDRGLSRSLGLDDALRVSGLAEGHRCYLPWHRERVFRK